MQFTNAIHQRNSTVAFRPRNSPPLVADEIHLRNPRTELADATHLCKPLTRFRQCTLQALGLDLKSVPARGHRPQGRILKGGHAPGRARWHISREALYVIAEAVLSLGGHRVDTYRTVV